MNVGRFPKYRLLGGGGMSLLMRGNSLSARMSGASFGSCRVPLSTICETGSGWDPVASAWEEEQCG